MLELKGISKRYNTGGFEQTAMDHISVAFRDNEFVAVLGPSGSGKTTMLNVIGGLDRFDSGWLMAFLQRNLKNVTGIRIETTALVLYSRVITLFHIKVL